MTPQPGTPQLSPEMSNHTWFTRTTAHKSRRKLLHHHRGLKTPLGEGPLCGKSQEVQTSLQDGGAGKVPVRPQEEGQAQGASEPLTSVSGGPSQAARVPTWIRPCAVSALSPGHSGHSQSYEDRSRDEGEPRSSHSSELRAQGAAPRARDHHRHSHPPRGARKGPVTPRGGGRGHGHPSRWGRGAGHPPQRGAGTLQPALLALVWAHPGPRGSTLLLGLLAGSTLQSIGRLQTFFAHPQPTALARGQDCSWHVGLTLTPRRAQGLWPRHLVHIPAASPAFATHRRWCPDRPAGPCPQA